MNPGPPALPILRTGVSRWIKLGIIAFGLIVLFFIEQWALGWLVVYGLYRFFWGSANDLTGLNPYLLKAIGWAVALLVVYLTCARKAKFLKRWRVLGFLPVAFNLGFYLFTKDLYFRFSDGAPLQWAFEKICRATHAPISRVAVLSIPKLSPMKCQASILHGGPDR